MAADRKSYGSSPARYSEGNRRPKDRAPSSYGAERGDPENPPTPTQLTDSQMADLAFKRLGRK